MPETAGAVFSPCRQYRYVLWRQWDPLKETVVFCGLNPSTADEKDDDQTIRRELGYARAWGYGRLVKVNAYGLKSTNPKGLWTVDDPIGPENLATVLHWAQQAHLFVAAWGDNIRPRESFALRTMLRQAGIQVHALKLTQRGNPHHPLRLPAYLTPFPWLSAGMVEAKTDHPIASKAEAPGGAAHEAELPTGVSAHTVEVPPGAEAICEERDGA